jgi:hypothetical protein
MKKIMAIMLLASASLWAQSNAPATDKKPAEDTHKHAACSRHKEGKMECCEKAKQAKNASEVPECCKKGECSKMKHDAAAKKS